MIPNRRRLHLANTSLMTLFALEPRHKFRVTIWLTRKPWQVSRTTARAHPRRHQPHHLSWCAQLLNNTWPLVMARNSSILRYHHSPSRYLWHCTVDKPLNNPTGNTTNFQSGSNDTVMSYSLGYIQTATTT